MYITNNNNKNNPEKTTKNEHSTHKYHFRSSFWGGEMGDCLLHLQDDKCVLSLPAPAHQLTMKDGWMDG
jgi:hypothetical protein